MRPPSVTTPDSDHAPGPDPVPGSRPGLVLVASDRRGEIVLDHVVRVLESLGCTAERLPPAEVMPARGEYPELAYHAARRVTDGGVDRAVLLSGSGIGMCITANKRPGVRAVVGHDEWTVEIARRHHDANVLCLPVDMLGGPLLRLLLERWVTTPFEGGRHERRLGKLADVEADRPPRDPGEAGTAATE